MPFYAGLTLEEIGGRGVRWQDRDGGVRAPPPRSCSTAPLAEPPAAPDGPARWPRRRTLWAGAEVEHSPSLAFLATAPARRAVVGGRPRSSASRAATRSSSRVPAPQVDGHRAACAPACPPAASSSARAALPDGPVEIAPAGAGAAGLMPSRCREHARDDRQVDRDLRLLPPDRPDHPARSSASCSGRFQSRIGPNRVGPKGLMQPLADVVKLLSKEAFTPGHGGALDDGHRAGDLDRHGRGRDAGDHPVRALRRLGRRTSASTASTCRSASSTSSPSARSPSTGWCSAAGRPARSTRSSAPCAPPRS